MVTLKSGYSSAKPGAKSLSRQSCTEMYRNNSVCGSLSSSVQLCPDRDSGPGFADVFTGKLKYNYIINCRVHCMILECYHFDQKWPTSSAYQWWEFEPPNTEHMSYPLPHNGPYWMPSWFTASRMHDWIPAKIRVSGSPSPRGWAVGKQTTIICCNFPKKWFHAEIRRRVAFSWVFIHQHVILR